MDSISEWRFCRIYKKPINRCYPLFIWSEPSSSRKFLQIQSYLTDILITLNWMGQNWADTITYFTDGLFLSNNPLPCDCHLTWFSHWMWQWMKESQPIQNPPIENVMRLDDMSEKSSCVDHNTGTQRTHRESIME